MTDSASSVLRSEAPGSDWPVWAVYLGISWTWCIGMFLPVLLIRDYGNPAFWVFFLPNVIGAAAMGWLIRSPEESRAFVRAHAVAVQTFSLVTIAFHAFFIGWICFIQGDALWPAVGCLLMLLWMLPFARRLPRVGGIVVSTVAFLTSIGVGATLLRTMWRLDLASIVQRRTDAAPLDLLGLTLVCSLGFLLCPYLDATFHQARQHLPNRRTSRLGFAVGFGIVFAAMVALTYWYADLINLSATMRGVIGTYIAVHIAIQAAATIALHAATVQPRWSNRSLIALSGACFGLAAGGWAADAQEGEMIYRLFMGFYGLAAPAYVWIVGARRIYPPTRRQWLAVTVAVLVASPFYWLAFIERQMPWVIAGVAVVLASRVLAPAGRDHLAAEFGSGPADVAVLAAEHNRQVRQQK